MRNAIFQINKPATLQKVIAALDELATDIKDIGDIMNIYCQNYPRQGQMVNFLLHVISLI